MRQAAILGLVLIVASACVAGPGASSGFVGASGTAATSSSAQAASPSGAAAWSPPPVPALVDGQPVRTVSQAIADRDAGRLGSTSFQLGGYWTVRNSLASCPMPLESPRDLEWQCLGYVAGITERYEAILTPVYGVQSSTTRGPDGPSLQPWIPASLTDRLVNGVIAANWELSPMPIVVVGHFDDPRAAQCHPDQQAQCREELVLERVLVFDPASAPAPTPSPAPTPFPSPAPSGLFEPQACNGDVPYSFVGWTTPAGLHSDLQGDGHIWAVVTRDVVLIGNWFESVDAAGQQTGHFSRTWARRVCTGQLGMGSGIRYGVILGTAFAEWDDGRRTTTEPFGPGTGDPSYPPAGAVPALPPVVNAEMHGPGLAPVEIAIHDWSGLLESARPATDAELEAPGAETDSDHAAAVRVLSADPRSVLVVWAECGSDSSATIVITKDRGSVLIKGAPRTDCGQPGARRGAVITFRTSAPQAIEAITGL